MTPATARLCAPLRQGTAAVDLGNHRENDQATRARRTIAVAGGDRATRGTNGRWSLVERSPRRARRRGASDGGLVTAPRRWGPRASDPNRPLAPGGRGGNESSSNGAASGQEALWRSSRAVLANIQLSTPVRRVIYGGDGRDDLSADNCRRANSLALSLVDFSYLISNRHRPRGWQFSRLA